MVRKFGVFFAVLLVVLLLSNTNYNANNQVFAQNTSGTIEPNVTQTPTPTPTPTDTPTPTPTQSPSTNITKLTGGVKINSPDKGDLVPLNSNKSLVINGVSKDNASSDCDVTIIVNNVKPYQNVQPTGIQGNNDYSTWQYTLTSNYTSINEGNNKITSKIYCASSAGGSLGAGTASSPQPSQAYYSVNITASNFTQAQLTNYELMLESASNSTNGNSTLVSNGIQPVAQIQQFNQDTGSGPVCCKTTSALTTQSSDSGTGSSSSSNNDDDDSDDSSSSRNDDDDDDNDSSSSSSSNDDDDDDNDSSSSSSRNDDDDDDNDSSSSSSRNDDDDDDNDSSSSSSRNDDDDDSFDFSNRMNDFDFGFDFDTDSGGSDSSWSEDSGDDSGVDSILDDVEDTMRSAGLDFSFS